MFDLRRGAVGAGGALVGAAGFLVASFVPMADALEGSTLEVPDSHIEANTERAPGGNSSVVYPFSTRVLVGASLFGKDTYYASQGEGFPDFKGAYTSTREGAEVEKYTGGSDWGYLADVEMSYVSSAGLTLGVGFRATAIYSEELKNVIAFSREVSNTDIAIPDNIDGDPYANVLVPNAGAMSASLYGSMGYTGVGGDGTVVYGGSGFIGYGKEAAFSTTGSYALFGARGFIGVPLGYSAWFGASIGASYRTPTTFEIGREMRLETNLNQVTAMSYFKRGDITNTSGMEVEEYYAAPGGEKSAAPGVGTQTISKMTFDARTSLKTFATSNPADGGNKLEGVGLMRGAPAGITKPPSDPVGTIDVTSTAGSSWHTHYNPTPPGSFSGKNYYAPMLGSCHDGRSAPDKCAPVPSDVGGNSEVRVGDGQVEEIGTHINDYTVESGSAANGSFQDLRIRKEHAFSLDLAFGLILLF